MSSRNCLHSVVGSIHSCSNMCMGTSLTILWRQVTRKLFCVDMTAYQKHRMRNRRFSVYLLTQIAVVTEKTTLSCRPPTATFTAWGPQLKNVTLEWIESYRNWPVIVCRPQFCFLVVKVQRIPSLLLSDAWPKVLHLTA